MPSAGRNSSKLDSSKTPDSDSQPTPAPSPYSAHSRETLSDARVWLVASTAITPLRVLSAAGLMAGSIATTGTGQRSRSMRTATEVTVLQATTITDAPACSR